MCPLYPLHLVFGWGFPILFLWVWGGQTITDALEEKTTLGLRLLLDRVPIRTLDVSEDEVKQFTFFVDDLPPDAVGQIILQEESEDGMKHIQISPERFPLRYDAASEDSKGHEVNVSGSFLGFSKVKFSLQSSSEEDSAKEEKEVLQLRERIPVKIHRETKTLDIIFIHVVIGLVLIAYINMGCAINIEVIKDTLKRPVAPAIGLASQYLFMPLVSFGIGYALFPTRPELWLGLFLTGCAPGGGGSNMWTYVLGGSLDLSITMTFLSTVFAFATLPLWVYALAPTIFADGHYSRLPYRNIAVLVFGLVVPCCIGLGIRRCCPKAADALKKMLKPLSIFFILFIMTFGVYAKFYIFAFFTWQVALSGFCLPFLGFAFGGCLSLLLNRSWEEVVAISIETGVQNTGLAIGVIKIALDNVSPLDDIAIIMPIAIATMTPVPLLISLITKYFRGRKQKNQDLLNDKFDESCVTITNLNYKKDTNGNSKFIIP